MNARIYALSTDLANQIAAGEVIERPASVVKELLENALDAQAHHIQITIEAGGVGLIEITDDGIGIHPDDLSLAVMSHATSKIRVLDDLFSINSLGFRGEALASIAAVSRFSMVSKRADCSTGYALNIPNISPSAHPTGTTITVRDLFYNTPVRRRFLHAEKTEWAQIETIVKRMALSRFDVGFDLTYKTQLHLPQCSNDTGIAARIKKIFGAAFLSESVKIDVKNHDMRLWGWVGLPSLMRSQNDLQYLYLNGRSVKDKLMSRAMRMAYEHKLYPGRQPVVLLYLEMPPDKVDINVHPTKHEVRFQEPRLVHDFMFSALSHALNTTNNEPIPPQSAINTIRESSGQYHAQTPITIQWLAQPYGIITSPQFPDATLLCNYQQLYQAICRNRYEKEIADNTIITRPLFVPVRLPVSTQLANILIPLIPQLATLGLSLDFLDENTLIVRAFPAVLPHLNFHQWLKIMSVNNHNLIDSLIQSNQPSWPISPHEQEAILSDFQQHLMQNPVPAHIKKCYRMIQQNDWEKIFDFLYLSLL